MPRRSAAASELSTIAVERLRPPPDLTGPERDEFLRLVLSCSPSHFEASDLPLLSAYCRAVTLEKVASGELAACGHVSGDKPSPWLAVLAQATRSMTVISRLLRLNPVARQSLASADDRQAAATSYYERMTLEAKRDETEAD